MVVLHIFISVAAPCDKSIVRAAIHRIPNFNLLSYKYRIQNYKIKNAQIQNDRNKELHNICSWSIVAWQLLPTEFPSSICFPTNSTPFPSITTTYFTITQAYINPIFTLQLAFFMTMSQCQICTNESTSTKKEPKVKAKWSITPPCGIQTPH